ncbi:hypothetical protein GCM10020370_12210 [Paenibacillus hodogayensis]
MNTVECSPELRGLSRDLTFFIASTYKRWEHDTSVQCYIEELKHILLRHIINDQDRNFREGEPLNESEKSNHTGCGTRNEISPCYEGTA